MDSWDEVHNIVKALSKALAVPVCCKIRVYPVVQKTVDYVRMLESAGCALLAVHGRTVEQRGSGLASWEAIRQAVKAVDIPVLANGNIRSFEDSKACLRATGAAGVMSAEALLQNPGLFATSGAAISANNMLVEGEIKGVPSEVGWARKYLRFARSHPPCSPRIVRRHIFRLLSGPLHRNLDLYDILFSAEDIAVMANVVEDIAQRAATGIEVLTPRSNGRPRRLTSSGSLYPPPIGGVGAEPDVERRKRPSTH